uniref:RING-type domain-containing protein n=1 Tax=Amphimedon queenslandica TaxID=400682 RepID=A0A1X7VHH8_AMPQE
MSMKSNIDCFICTNYVGDNVAVLVCCCKLCYYDCITRWLEESATCPHCRQELHLENLQRVPKCNEVEAVFSVLREYQSTTTDDGDIGANH